MKLRYESVRYITSYVVLRNISIVEIHKILLQNFIKINTSFVLSVVISDSETSSFPEYTEEDKKPPGYLVDALKCLLAALKLWSEQTDVSC